MAIDWRVLTISLPLLTYLLVNGCATTQKIQVVQAGDSKMSCEELTEDLEKLGAAEAAVDDKKGATGTNVAAALFWLPGLAYTYYDAGQALEAVRGRRSHLTELYNDKDC